MTTRRWTLASVLSLTCAGVMLAGCSGDPVAPIPMPPLSAVVMTVSPDTIRVGETTAFTATAYDTLGAVVGGATFTWTTSNAAVASVSQNGNVSGQGEGTAIIYAAAGGFRDSAFITVYPDTGWILQVSNATEDLYGVFFQPDGRSGWAVGSGGLILRTLDAGVTWTRTIVSGGYDMHGVWFTNSSEGWAVGNLGTIARTTNGGNTWTRLTNVGASEALQAVTFASPDTGWVVGASGAILRTFDAGASWTKVNETSNTLRSVAFAGTLHGWAVGDGGVILGTHDRGLNWFIVQPSVTSNDLRTVVRRSESVAWAAGELGAAPRTVVPPGDSTTWVNGNAGAANDIFGASFPTDLNGYAVGLNGVGTVIRTEDGGNTWSQQAPNAQFQLNAVYFVDGLRGWVVGDNGTIRHTARGGVH